MKMKITYRILSKVKYLSIYLVYCLFIRRFELESASLQFLVAFMRDIKTSESECGQGEIKTVGRPCGAISSFNSSCSCIC